MGERQNTRKVLALPSWSDTIAADDRCWLSNTFAGITSDCEIDPVITSNRCGTPRGRTAGRQIFISAWFEWIVNIKELPWICTMCKLAGLRFALPRNISGMCGRVLTCTYHNGDPHIK